MRLFSLVALFFVGTMSIVAQVELPRNESTGKVEFVEVINVDGATAAQLYKRLAHWYNTFYTNPGGVIEKREENAEISGKHFIKIHDVLDGKQYPKGNVRYFITVQVKDGRYRYVLDDIYYYQTPKLYIEEWYDETAVNKEIQYNYLQQAKTFTDELVSSLKANMSQPLAEEGGDDW